MKKLSYHRDSAGRRSLRCSGSYKVTDFCTNQLSSQRPNKADDRAGSKTLFYCTRKHTRLQSEISREFFSQFSPICCPLHVPPGALVRPAPPHPPRYATVCVTVASPAMGHWGTCPPQLTAISFLVYFRVNLTANYLSSIA